MTEKIHENSGKIAIPGYRNPISSRINQKKLVPRHIIVYLKNTEDKTAEHQRQRGLQSNQR